MTYDPELTTAGAGPPLLLVPGLDGTGKLFYRQIDRLAERYRVGTFRLRERAADMDRLVADLDGIFDELRVHRACTQGAATIIGESFGGALAMSYALARPENVSRLVILNSFPYFTPQIRLWLGQQLLRAMPWGMMRLVRRLTASRMHSVYTGSHEIQTFHTLMRATTRAGYLSRLAILRQYDIRSRLPALRTPTLFLAADCDHLVPAVQQAELMASLVPQSEVRVLEGHGHICLIAPNLDLAAIVSEWAMTDR